jgi:hypothetical protein
MSRRRTMPPAVPSAPKAVVAAAGRYDPRRPDSIGKPKGSNEWQTEVWAFRDLIGEFLFSTEWLGNCLSRVKLKAVEVDALGRIGEDAKDQTVLDAVDGLCGSPSRQAGILKTLGDNLSTVGEAWVIAETRASAAAGGAPIPGGDTGDEVFASWTVASTEEVKQGQGGAVILDRGDGKKRTVDPDEGALVIRIWNPDARRHNDAFSWTKAALPILREMVDIERYVLALMESRYANSGLLLVPSELSFPYPDPADLVPGEDPLIVGLSRALTAAISDPGTASAVAPIIIRGAAQHLAEVRHISFAAALEAVVAGMRQDCIRRLALTAAHPPEVLTGLGDSTHWNAALVDETAMKLYVEPFILLICAALTDAYLRPVLEAAGVADPEAWALWYDASELLTDPDRTEDVRWAFEHGVINADTARRELGFEETDAPVDKDPAIEMAMELVRSAPNLMKDPGLASIVEQIRATLEGRDADEELIKPLGGGTDEAGNRPEVPGEDGTTDDTGDDV